MALLVHGVRENGDMRGLLVAGTLMRRGEGVLFGVMHGVGAIRNTRGLLLAGLPVNKGGEFTGVATMHGAGARGSIVVLVSCRRSGTLAPCTTWA